MRKTTFSEKLGYGIASLGDAISYGFVGTFFLFFLTTVVEIQPAIAGTIVAIGSLWDACFNPIMGYFADRIRTKFGRRRPVILFFSVFLFITLFLMFTNIDIPAGVKPVYYGFMTLMFWTTFTGFFIPYYALGADYASDYDERTSIRSFASFFNMIGTLFCMVMPTMIVDFLENHGFTASGAWSATGCFLGLLTLISILITVAASKKKDLPCAREQNVPKEKRVLSNIFREYISISKLPPLKYLVVASLMSLIVSTMLMSDMIYYLTYNKGSTPFQISFCLFERSLLGLILIPVMGKLSARLDKRATLMICYTIGIAGMIVVRLAQIDGFAGCLIYVIFITFCTSIYWQIMPAIFYDVCEYDTTTTGQRREATILSFQGLVEAVATGIGNQLLGMILQLAGFDGSLASQSPTAMLWIENTGTVLPMVFLLTAIFALYKYPLRREQSDGQTKPENTKNAPEN